ncbi:TonB-dependent receptor [Rhizorhabdus dicambivorans]|uniref:TonB-dependent receptor n=1 Tax=Rhizorhabdus dicambivorans TaxID=1850238 RepID=A0A2A4FYY9_9SPHN|nr:TonB-dependent receptor [Rhizorhabdus dicambivorans]ATE65819.1 TonB-dependent receptor [Rhizorhabdus dicambivorans]PCE42932.1 TonB-dependent receptor [Rhizorhabdus dicambivorans]
MRTAFGIRRRIALSLAGVALVLPAAGRAQATAADDNSEGLQEIVVTAQKRSQNLQEVPVAVSAVDSGTLASANITSANDLGRIVPSLTIFATSGSVQPFLRGIGNPGSLVGNEASNAVYIDGVYLVRVPSTLLQLNSIARVEVLKGPQGTLFGRNASGGLIHIITRDPSETPTAEGSIGYGNYNMIRVSAYASAGIAEGLAFDVTGLLIDQGDGWGKNVVTGRDWGRENTKAVRGKLRWKSETTTVTLTGDYNRSDNDFIAQSQYLPGIQRGYDLPPFGLQPKLPFYDIEANDTPVSRSRNWGVSARIEHDLSFATLTSITAYRRDKSYIVFDSDFGRSNLLRADLYGRVRQVSQELQLASRAGSSFDWLLGAFYLNSRSAYVPSRFTGLAIDFAAGGLPAVSDTYGRSSTKSAAAYGQATVHLTDKLDLTVGARYTQDKLSGAGRGDFYLVGSPVIPAPTITGRDTFKKFTYKGSLDYKISDDVMVYASQSRGYKAGLFNTLPFLPTAAKPEILDASEVGFKSELFDRRLRLNGAGFHYSFKNAQFQQFRGPTVVIINAPKARIYGAELEAQAALADGLTVRFGGGWLNSKYTDFPNAQTPVANLNTNPALGPVGGYVNGFAPLDASGNDMVRVPKWTFNIGLNYGIETSAGKFDFDINYAYNDGFAWDADNALRQSSYGLLDAQLKYTLPGRYDRFAIRAWAKNLTREKYYVAQIQSDGARGSSAMPGAPRTYGLDLLFSF